MIPIFGPEWFTHHRENLGHWRHDNLHQVLADLAEIEQQVQQLLADQQARITTITVTATQGDTTMPKQLGETLTFTATSADANGATVPDTYTWTATAGTIVAGPDTTSITVVNAPVGDVTATATDPSGVTGSATETVVDAVTTVTVTAS